ncbi:hypothetical protein CEXT_793181 [Caerostris extrusa]|uniref:Secreted protein n=1 Tax=Caerostris extrusa TaxID=172846 RepID=A0AAV4V5Q3_CAEEX|nr:hypothetical protein CEXT_793181 [Caerostris extrusa]
MEVPASTSFTAWTRPILTISLISSLHGTSTFARHGVTALKYSKSIWLNFLREPINNSLPRSMLFHLMALSPSADTDCPDKLLAPTMTLVSLFVCFSTSVWVTDTFQWTEM